MSSIAYIRTASNQRFATISETGSRPRLDSSVRARLRVVLREIAAAVAVIAVGTSIMAGLVALRLWFLMPTSFHLAG